VKSYHCSTVFVAGLLLVVGSQSACQSNDQSEQALAALNAPEPVKGAVQAPAASAESAFNPRLLRRFKPARAEISGPELTTERIELGRLLYHETRLSRNHELSCNSCHALDRYGVDSKPTSTGHKGQLGSRNAPTVYHAAAAFEQFWDGRAADVEAQALGPILNPVEMAAPNREYVVKVLNSIPEYVTGFKLAFPGEASPVTFENVGKAIGAFERKLTTRSRWDDYLEGNEKALNAAELDGLKVSHRRAAGRLDV
jgi:cytochrome c peroxidase